MKEQKQKRVYKTKPLLKEKRLYKQEGLSKDDQKEYQYKKNVFFRMAGRKRCTSRITRYVSEDIGMLG